MKIKLFFVLGFSLYILPLSALHTHTHIHTQQTAIHLYCIFR